VGFRLEKEATGSTAQTDQLRTWSTTPSIRCAC